MKFYTAGYKQRKELPTQAVNIACRPSGLFRESGRKSIGILFPGSAVWAAGKTPGGDWKAAYRQQLEKHLQSGKLAAVVSGLQDGDVIMCWEADPNDCHRLVAAQFISEHFPGVEYAGEWWESHAAPQGAGTRASAQATMF